jgi:TRAP-type transport system small permease protein
MKSPAESYAGPGAGAIHALLRVMNATIILSGCIMALTFFCVVVLRYGFSADLFAYEEWLLVIAFWFFFMGSAVATYENSHINADILGIFLSRPKTMWLRALVVMVIEFLILVYLSYLGFLMVLDDVSDYPRWQTTIALKIPFLVPRLGIFVGFLLMTVFTALALIVHLKTDPNAPAQDEHNTEVE